MFSSTISSGGRPGFPPHAQPRNRLPHASRFSKRGHLCSRYIEGFSDALRQCTSSTRSPSRMFTHHRHHVPVHGTRRSCPTGCTDTTVPVTRTLLPPVVTGDCRCWEVRG